MRSITAAFRRKLNNDQREYLCYADITLNDNPSNPTVLHFTNAVLWSGGLSCEQAVSDDNSFTAIGSAIIGSATLVLNNMDESLSDYDFDNATVVLEVGIQTGSTIPRVRLGTYRVDEPTFNGDLLTLSLLDYMEQFDRAYDTNLAYPARLYEIVSDACQKCGVTIKSISFPRNTFIVSTKPDKESTTFREVISWVAQIAGCFARCDVNGQLELKWFDTGSFSVSSKCHTISSLASINIGIDDTVITGVSITVENDGSESAPVTVESGITKKEDETTTTYEIGSSGYVIHIEKNPLITNDKAVNIIGWLGTRLIGTTFRKAEVSHLDDPAIEAGDIAKIIDRKGNSYNILVTRVTFAPGQYQTVVCGSESPLRNSSKKFSESVKNFVKAKKILKEEQTAREQALADLSSRLSAKTGLYTTVVNSQSGGKIYYLHDMETLNESHIVWKMNTEAWGVTTDYNAEHPEQTVWNAGITVNGDVIANILNAIGVNASWIRTGRIRSQDGSVYIDLDNNVISVNGKTSFLTASDVGANGTTVIDGGRIITGKIADSGNNTVFNLSDGSLNMKKGTIQLGSSTDYLKIDNNGVLTSIKDNYKLLIDSSRMIGHIGTVKYGVLNLNIMDVNNNNAKTVLLESGKNLVLDAATKIELSIGSTGQLAGDYFDTSNYARAKILTITSSRFDINHNVINLNDNNGNAVFATTSSSVIIKKNTIKFQNANGNTVLSFNSQGINSLKTGGDAGLTQTFYIYEGKVNSDGVLTPIYTAKTQLVFKNGILTAII